MPSTPTEGSTSTSSGDHSTSSNTGDSEKSGSYTDISEFSESTRTATPDATAGSHSGNESEPEHGESDSESYIDSESYSESYTGSESESRSQKSDRRSYSESSEASSRSYSESSEARSRSNSQSSTGTYSKSSHTSSPTRECDDEEDELPDSSLEKSSQDSSSSETDQDAHHPRGSAPTPRGKENKSIKRSVPKNAKRASKMAKKLKKKEGGRVVTDAFVTIAGLGTVEVHGKMPNKTFQKGEYLNLQFVPVVDQVKRKPVRGELHIKVCKRKYRFVRQNVGLQLPTLAGSVMKDMFTEGLDIRIPKSISATTKTQWHYLKLKVYLKNCPNHPLKFVWPLTISEHRMKGRPAAPVMRAPLASLPARTPYHDYESRSESYSTEFSSGGSVGPSSTPVETSSESSRSRSVIHDSEHES